jgi:hypothetical protein
MSLGNEPKLDELFAVYRDALPDREPSAGFTPELWRRIDYRRKPSFTFGRFARGFVTASLALSLAMTAVTWSSAKSAYTATYVDVLDDDLATSKDVDAIQGESL